MNSQPNPVDLQKHLAGVEYPADRDTLVQTAQENGADTPLVEQLELIPLKEYSGPDEVSEALYQQTRTPDS